MCHIEDDKDFYILILEKDIQTQVFQQRDMLYGEIDELWKLMKKIPKSNITERGRKSVMKKN